MTAEKRASLPVDTDGAEVVTADNLCRVIVGGKECGEGWASHTNGTIYVHAFAANGVNRPNPQLRLIEVGGLADDFATGF